MTNEFDCPLLELEDKLETVLSSKINCIVNIVHKCTETCVFRDSTELQTIEREETPKLALIYDHDNSNNIQRKINDYKSFLDVASFYYIVSFLIITSTKKYNYVMDS